jgi:hypothetical protein
MTRPGQFFSLLGPFESTILNKLLISQKSIINPLATFAAQTVNYLTLSVSKGLLELL